MHGYAKWLLNWLVVAGWACIFLAVPYVAEAAPDKPVQIEAEIGWPGLQQGKGLYGRYMPAVVKVDNNSDQDLIGVLQAVNYDRQTHSLPPDSPTEELTTYSASAAFGEVVSLCAGETKKITLWLPMNTPGERIDFIFQSDDQELGRITVQTP